MRNKIVLRHVFCFFLMLAVFIAGKAQTGTKPLQKSLLWEISGNGLTKPSYLYGTIHMICKDDASLGDSLLAAIQRCDRVYFEVDMDNLLEMITALKDFKMRNDTTLADLLSKEDYEKVKGYMESKGGPLPFSKLETYKPMLASSLLMESGIGCEESVAMEQLILEEAKKNKKRVEGLETMSYQASIFDSIPYKLQAEQLLKYVNDDGSRSQADKQFEEMIEAYKAQDIEKLGEYVKDDDSGLGNYEDILIYNRNRNWVQKLKTLMSEKSLTIAVGAGHLAGEKGLIKLLRKEGYTVKPVKYKMKTERA
ncbi:MAG TPA: TraB/GumN family protein, partial [Chitinophagaceae bacterium]